jgi:peptidoglycan-associated lipoprotein
VYLTRFYQKQLAMETNMPKIFAAWKPQLTPLLSRPASILVLCLLLFFVFGCSKKTVIPPDGGTAGVDAGSDINYPLAEGGFQEDTLPTDGRLDDTTRARLADAGAASLASEGQSDEYKRIHGRSSTNLLPVFFDFDQAGIRADMTEVLFRNAAYLNSVPGAVVVIEGNCDERGTNEYNLALGERRAINTMQYLINIGVAGHRLRTLSYGEEKPLFFGQDEESYSYNRRADFVIQ